jgi:RND family efflux transporter MFP subunit
MDRPTGFSTTTAEIAVQTRSRTRRKFVRWLVILSVLAVLAIGAWSFSTVPLSVAAARPARGAVAEVVYATGFVEPRRPVDVSSRVTAPVITVLADEGDHVSRGQALAMLDAEDLRETMAQLSASRINAEQDERRALALFAQGWSTNADRDKAVASANSARALENAARARLNQYTLRSGISGVILRRDVEPGDLATAAKTLFEVGDPKQLRVTATVDERDIPLVRTGSAALMSTEAYPGRVLRGHVYEITPGGNPDQRAFRVRIAPDSAASLPVGLTLEVNILASDRQNALLVPPAAIHGSAVWVVDNGRVRRTPVRVGIRGADRTEIRSGLPDNACVLIDPPDKLKDGDRVRAKSC